MYKDRFIVQSIDRSYIVVDDGCMDGQMDGRSVDWLDR